MEFSKLKKTSFFFYKVFLNLIAKTSNFYRSLTISNSKLRITFAPILNFPWNFLDIILSPFYFVCLKFLNLKIPIRRFSARYFRRNIIVSVLTDFFNYCNLSILKFLIKKEKGKFKYVSNFFFTKFNKVFYRKIIRLYKKTT